MVTFADEAKDHIAKLNDGFLSLEKNLDDTGVLNQIFRSAHTIKGSSKILGITAISELAHRLEDTLEALRSKRIQTSKDLFNLLFQAADTLTEMTDRVREGNEITEDFGDVCQHLELAAKGELSTLSDEKTEQTAQAESSQEVVQDEELQREKPQESVENPAKNKNSVVDKIPSESVRQGESKSQNKPEKRGKAKEESIRIQLEKLDRTIKLAGEVSSLQTLLKQNLSDLEKIEDLFRDFAHQTLQNEEKSVPAEAAEKTDLNALATGMIEKFKKLHLNSKDSLSIFQYLTSDLREVSLKMRMVPISTILNTFTRMVRDLSASSGKEARLIIEGGETELDKKISEKVGDPLLHIVRNCFDHGIESKDKRLKVGKPGIGTIKISAGYEGSNVLIRIRDDGQGIPTDLIKQKALKKKLFDQETLKLHVLC